MGKDSTWHKLHKNEIPEWVDKYEFKYGRKGGTADVWGKRIILKGKRYQYKLQFGLPPKGWDDHGQCAVPIVSCKVYRRLFINQRMRGIAIIDRKDKGILVVAGRNKKFYFPGGGADKHEGRKKATIREIKEEIGLNVVSIEELFKDRGKTHKGYGGKIYRNRNKVFLVECEGKIKPDKKEIFYVDYYTPGKKIDLTAGTKLIIDISVVRKTTRI